MKGGKCSLLLLSSPSAASLFRSFTSFPHSLSLFLSLIQNPIRYHNRRSILKQRPSMDGDSSWSARLSSASRRYQSALQSRSGSPSLLFPNSIHFSPLLRFLLLLFRMRSLWPKNYNLRGCGGWILCFDVLKGGKIRDITWNFLFSGKLFSWWLLLLFLLLLMMIFMVIWCVWIIYTGHGNGNFMKSEA